jgi:hypothetical protein
MGKAVPYRRLRGRTHLLGTHVIPAHFDSRCGCLSMELEVLTCPCVPGLPRSRGPSGEAVVRLGMPLADDYLESRTTGVYRTRCWRRTLIFGCSSPWSPRHPGMCDLADLLGLIAAQRTGRSGGADGRSRRVAV